MEMIITNNQNGTYAVGSRSNEGKTYEVSATMDSCSCPKFKYILKGRGICHHMDEVKRKFGKTSRDLEPEKFGEFKIFNLETYTEPLKLWAFLDKYGEEQYDYLLKRFDVILIKNKVRKL
tara:strand:+ start:347 stop:706 length:360 start_codon:yes stop_codon:yes gene_type:complete